MGLKQLINKYKILEKCHKPNFDFVITEAPMIYSIKFNIGERRHAADFFRNKRWHSILKCFFKAHFNPATPVVLIVKFYVKPPDRAYAPPFNLTDKQVKAEKTPAVANFELCEYLLSFLEMLNKTLFNTYRQMFKVDMEKYYSNDPRIVFQFMSYYDYKNIYDGDPVDAKGKTKRATK